MGILTWGLWPPDCEESLSAAQGQGVGFGAVGAANSCGG